MHEFSQLSIPALGMPAYRALYGMFMDALVQVPDETKTVVVQGMKGATFARFMLALVDDAGSLRLSVFYESERPWLRLDALINGQFMSALEVRHDAIGVAAATIEVDQRLRMEEAIADITERCM